MQLKLGIDDGINASWLACDICIRVPSDLLKAKLYKGRDRATRMNWDAYIQIDN